MKFLGFATIFSSIVLSSVYIINPKINFFRIFGSILFVCFLFSHLKGRNSILPSTKAVIRWSFILIFFRFFIDITFHFENMIDPINALLKQSLTVLALPIFEKINYKKNSIEKNNILFNHPLINGILSGI